MRYAGLLEITDIVKTIQFAFQNGREIDTRRKTLMPIG